VRDQPTRRRERALRRRRRADHHPSRGSVARGGTSGGRSDRSRRAAGGARARRLRGCLPRPGAHPGQAPRRTHGRRALDRRIRPVLQRRARHRVRPRWHGERRSRGAGASAASRRRATGGGAGMTELHHVAVEETDIAFDCVPGRTLLDAAEAAGWSLPYSCRRGVCNSCLGTITSGTVRDQRTGRENGPREDALLCQVVPDGPVRIRPRRITRSGPPRRRRLTARVYRVRHPAPHVVVLELRYPIGRRIPFRAGQYLEVRLPGAESRPYSFANPPRDNDMAELHVRIEPGGRFSDRTARHLRPGDLVTIEAPYGDAALEPGAEPL